MDLTHADRDLSRRVGRCVTWWRMRLQALAAGREWDGLGADEQARLARDLSVSLDELHRLAHDDRGDGLMQRMLAAHGLSFDTLRRDEPATARDMAVACAGCGDKRRCAQDLDAGAARLNAVHYCPNVPRFDFVRP